MKKPNILLITSDQQHYSMLGAVNDKIKTPYLDHLAEEGMLFNRSYCSNPTCSPSRASILTGMNPSEHGCWTLGTKLPEFTPTLSQYLRNNGYETALIGKAHFQPTVSTNDYPSLESKEYLSDLDFWRNFNQDFYGFNHVELLRNHTAEHWVGQHYAIWLEEKCGSDWKKYFFKPSGTMKNQLMGRWHIPEKLHYNTWIAERTNAMLEKYKKEDKPFFMWASFPDPHYPQLVPSPWDKMYNPNDMELQKFSFKEHDKNPPYFKEVTKLFPHLEKYRETGFGCHGLQKHWYIKSELKKQLAYAYGMVSFMDKYIGKILDKLKELDLENNTIIVFTTDHGDLFGQHGLRHKCIFHYEDLLRIPMIVKYKGEIPAGTCSDSLQSLTDLAPTFLSYCGLPIPNCMTGVNQADVWNGTSEKKRTYVISENRHEPNTLHMCSFIEEQYKVTVHVNQTYGELYDLKNDPQEHCNLWDEKKYLPVKADLIFKYIKAELHKLKSDDTYIYENNGLKLEINCNSNSGLLCKLNNFKLNLWNDDKMLGIKTEMLHACLSEILSNQPMWMPRIANA